MLPAQGALNFNFNFGFQGGVSFGPRHFNLETASLAALVDLKV